MINDPNSIRNRLCKNKSINISEMLRNRIAFQKAHEKTETDFEKSLREFGEALNDWSLFKRR